MDFYEYVISKYKGKSNPKGDFADDLSWDKKDNEKYFINNTEIFKHLDKISMCDDARKVYKQLKKEYEKYLKEE